MNRNDIEMFLGFGKPCIMIDSVSMEKPGRVGTGYKTLTGDEYFFEGHFPGRPVMPGVLIVEAISQTAMVVSGRSGLRISGVEKVRFRQTIEPGDRLEIKTELAGEEEGRLKFHGEVIVDENIAASGSVVLG